VKAQDVQAQETIPMPRYHLSFRIAAVSCALVPVARLFAQTISFLPPVQAYEAGVTPAAAICASCIVTADFNKDGKPDIAFTIAGPVPVAAVQLGNGDGTFRPVAGYLPVNQSMGTPFTGDFNGDGKPDLVISGASTWLYLGKGDGTFSAPVAILGCSVTPSTELVAVADLNRDGYSDMLCGTSVLLSNGDGTFRSAGTVGTIPMETVMTVADFNNDGIPDVVLREVGFRIDVVLGHGDGTFGSELHVITLPETNILVPGSLFAADFNGDGKIDLAGFFGRSDAIDVLPGNGDGTFGAVIPTSASGINAEYNYFGGAADFNHDGKLDVMVGTAIFAGNGDGSFRFPVFIGPVPDACGAATTSSLACDYALTATAIADFNGDGLPDLVTGSVLGSYLQGLEGLDSSVVTALLNDSPGDGFTVTGISSASFSEPVGAGSIVSAFGVNLAPSAAAATTNPAPTTLGGIRLHVRDRSHTTDMLAPLLYVSPTQINYVLPSTDPYAWVGIERVGSAYLPKGLAVPIVPLAPDLYSTPNFLAAANAITVSPGGVVTSPVSSCAVGVCFSVPIDLSGGPVYLSLYGTGFDQASASASTCNVGAARVTPTYAGPELQIAGLDQVNILLPASLAGSGSVTAGCTFVTSGQVYGGTNAVILNIR
jgi:uncharacterized protein (TIGR03437 family)